MQRIHLCQHANALAGDRFVKVEHYTEAVFSVTEDRWYLACSRDPRAITPKEDPSRAWHTPARTIAPNFARARWINIGDERRSTGFDAGEGTQEKKRNLYNDYVKFRSRNIVFLLPRTELRKSRKKTHEKAARRRNASLSFVLQKTGYIALVPGIRWYRDCYERSEKRHKTRVCQLISRK